MLYFRYLFSSLSFFFLVACSSTPQPVDGSDEKFAQKAISIEYTSSKKLNAYDNQPHAIPLVVYQLNDRNAFDALAKDSAGIIKLLEAKPFDASVMSVTKYYVSPNETRELLLNRSTKTAWIAIVVGYYEMQPSQSTIIYQTPPYNSLKFWNSKESQQFLEIDIYLDKSSIEKRQK